MSLSSPDLSSPDASPAIEDAEVIDERSFREFSVFVADESPEVLAELVTEFVESADTLVSRMSEAMAGGDATCLERAAHNLRSTSAMYGALKLSRLCAALEAAAHKGLSEEAAQGLLALTEHYALVPRALEEKKLRLVTPPLRSST